MFETRKSSTNVIYWEFIEKLSYLYDIIEKLTGECFLG